MGDEAEADAAPMMLPGMVGDEGDEGLPSAGEGRAPGEAGSAGKVGGGRSATVGPPARRPGPVLACEVDEDDGGVLTGLGGGELPRSVAVAAGSSGPLGGGWQLVAPDPASLDQGNEKESSTLELSARAEFESRLVGILPSREFTLDDEGKVDGDLVYDNEARTRRAEDRQVMELLPALRSSLERGLATQGAEVVLVEDGAVVGIEPRPSLVRTATRSRHDEGDVSSFAEDLSECIDERYKQLCRRMRLRVSPVACRALQTLGLGGEAMPKEFAGKGYLGNRGAKAVFLALGKGELLGDDAGQPPECESDFFEHGLKHLKRLDLVAQGIGNDAALALADALPQLPSLTALDVSRNHISKTGAHQLLLAIERHDALREVKIDGNPVPSWIRVRLAEVMERQAQASISRRMSSTR